MRFILDVLLITGALYLGVESLKKNQAEPEPSPDTEMVFTTEVEAPPLPVIDNSAVKAEVETVKQSLGGYATSQQLNNVQKELVDKYDNLNTKVDGIDTYVKKIPTECPKPEIPKEVWDEINGLKHRIEVLEPLDRNRKPINPRGASTFQDNLKELQDRQTQVKPQNKVQATIEQARREGKHVLFYYDQDICPWCRAYENEVINTNYVKNSLRNDVIFYKINKDHIGPGENFAIPAAVPAVQLTFVNPEGGVENTTITVPDNPLQRTPELFVSSIRQALNERTK